ncbi:GAF domain-containing protein [Lichenihabitans sp. Uapishka_5]|uniref:GAF domain-containing protein n=1 Tax=Lichenihabitans sp. Uapishka_5 TaxID=3037302 RepID=UPI0029E7CE7B|nr:GAF domain-containing protein [Lichenihabitans sp. Uapishka_5]
MTSLPLPPPLVGDAGRLAALKETGVLDTGPESAYDGVVLLARTLCAAPVALISLVAEERQWFKARSGFGPEETSLDASVCSHALGGVGLLIIPDLMQDDRTRDNPLVIAGPRLRFYAGAPLRTADGHALGTVCVLDSVPRPAGLTPEQAEGLQALATLVMALLAARRMAG